MDAQTIESVDVGDCASEECACFHCGLPTFDTADLSVRIDEKPRLMCCIGCQAVAQAIVDAGQEHFYRVRSAPSGTGQEIVPEFLRDARVYDDQTVQKQFVYSVSETLRETSLMLEGITCAACVWLNEQYISGLSGIEQVQVNYSTRRAWVRWDDSRIKLSEILQAIRAIGYIAHPYDVNQQQKIQQRERRVQLRRLALAGVLGMQVMMLSISLYAGLWSGMERGFEMMFRWVSLGLTTPVLLYSAVPFFQAAWRDLKHRRVGMDVPVSLGIGIAFAASSLATVTGQGHVYFDSVVMFVFFLLASRFFEWTARQRGAESLERLAHALPVMATRLSNAGLREDLVVAATLTVGDLVLVRAGDVVPADGIVTDGVSSVDESLLTGESRSVEKVVGDMLVGGTINIDSPLQVRVQSVGADTVLSSIHRLIERAQSTKPRLAHIADRVASYFVVAVLLIAVIVAVYWWMYMPDRWLEVTLTVLIVTCPCALSLATPAAFSVALARLQSSGLLVTQGGVLDVLDKVTHVVFDKTGTLTLGKPVIHHIWCDDSKNKSRYLAIAAALERHSEHPLALAFERATWHNDFLPVEGVINKPGGGLSATVEGEEFVIGSLDFIAQKTGHTLSGRWLEDLCSEQGTVVALANSEKLLCVFTLHDAVRSDANILVNTLINQGKKVLLLTGDRQSVAGCVAEQVGIADYHSGLTPAAKVAHVQVIQAAGGIVLMVGDGINDAPVLAAADVSIAMSSASSVAKTSAGVVLLGDRLQGVCEGLEIGRRTQRVVRQNFSWALTYNVLALPAAAAGLLLPWMAAIGMSLSSLVVVANALRLRR